MIAAQSLVIPLMHAYLWFDDGLQAYLQAKGWKGVTRPQSMVMGSVVTGVHKPAVIARNLGLSRQAVHKTVTQLVALEMVELRDDPDDLRAWIVVVAPKGQAMARDADAAVEKLSAELRRRIGARNVDNLIKAFQADWGEAPTSWPPHAAND